MAQPNGPRGRAQNELGSLIVDVLPIHSDSDCPSPEALQAQVRELTTPEQRAAVPLDAKVLVSDHNDSIAVAITRDGKTSVHVYQDAARDCERRNHFVSVLVVVSLMPPDIGTGDPEVEREPEPAPLPKPRPKPQPSSKGPKARLKHVRIELGARGEVGAPVADTVRIVSLGGALGVALGAGSLRLTLGGAYVPPTELRYTAATPGQGKLERFDVAVGGRWVFAHAPLDASVELAALASRSEVSGRSTQSQSQDTAFSLGGRAGLSISWGEQRALSPFLGAHASFYPAAPALFQLPQGTVGHLPYVWLGLSAGLALAL
jgi:hypothetical protein